MRFHANHGRDRRQQLSWRQQLTWLAVVVFVVAAGGVGSWLGARAVANASAQRARVAFAASAAEVGSAIKLELDREQDLELAAGAFIGQPQRPTQAEFLQWLRETRVAKRYPDLAGLAFVVPVPAAQLRAFEARYTAHPVAPLTDGRFVVIPAGHRPVYCFTALEYDTDSALNPPAGYDYCSTSPVKQFGLSGTSVTLRRLTGRLTVLAIHTPVYRGGSVPVTAAARSRDLLGWTGTALVPSVLLHEALRNEPHLSISLHDAIGGSTVSFSSGTPPAHARTIMINLHDGATVDVSGAQLGSGIFADSVALAILLGGIALSGLLGALVFTLATGRTRARRIVDQRTRELSEEVRLHALARDEAVEASNAKSVFVATVSHELRTPLAGVIGMSDLLRETDLTPTQREYADLISSSSENLLHVINDILDYSKVEAGKLELERIPFELAELIAESCATLIPVARNKGIALTAEIPPDLPQPVIGDPGRLRQVIINLLSNAVKFTSEGQVTLTVHATPLADSTRVRVEVADTGIGIDEPTLARLFEPFTQADNSTARVYGGTGLGLTISAQLIEMMGGTIGAHSTPGEGSTFWFEVPLATADDPVGPPRAPTNFAALGPRDGSGSLTDDAPLVLVAEDSPVNQMLAVRLLDKCGYRSEGVANGYEALEALEHGDYAAVLMDCQMPELDGYDASREIRRRERVAAGAYLPIVATTAHSMSGDREKCIAAGMDEYVSKPLRAVELRAALTRAIDAAAAIRGERGDVKNTVAERGGRTEVRSSH